MKTIGGYSIVRELARGGQGAVYVAQDPTSGRQVAIKLLLGAADAGAQQRFELEAEALARVSHPNVVAIHSFGRDGANQYLVMDLVEGESLQAHLERSGPLEPTKAAALLRTLAGALAHAHSKAVIHRDLKPHNVLLSADGRPLLTDFGLAARLEEDQRRLTQSGQMLGTPAYMAPEQVDGKHAALDVRTDVYGLGATLYALLTGRPPFTGTTQLQLVGALVARPPESPRSLRPDLDRALEAICLRCLEKDPAARYPTAAALAGDLDLYLSGDLEPPARPIRWPALAALGVVALAGALVLTRQETEIPAQPATVPREATQRRTKTPKPPAQLFALGSSPWSCDGLQKALDAKGRAVEGAQKENKRDHRGIDVHFLDARTLVAVSDRYQAVLVFSGSVERPHEVPHGIDEVFSTAAVRAEGRAFLAVGGAHPATTRGSGRGLVVLFELVKGQLVKKDRVELDRSVEALAFSPSGQQLAFGTAGRKVGLLNTARLEVGPTVEHPPPLRLENVWIKTLAFSSDGRELVSGDAASNQSATYSLLRWGVTDDGLRRQGDPVLLQGDPAQCVAATPGGGYVVGTVRRLLLLAPTGEASVELERPRVGPLGATQSARLRAVAQRDGDLFSAQWDRSNNKGQIYRWDRNRLVALADVLLPKPARPVSLSISPDGKRLAVGHSGPELLLKREGLNDLGRVDVLSLE